MFKYERLSIIGAGSYGQVAKARHKKSGQIVAIKRFIETEEDVNIRRLALREINLLKVSNLSTPRELTYIPYACSH